jgi:hypothetical protein
VNINQPGVSDGVEGHSEFRPDQSGVPSVITADVNEFNGSDRGDINGYALWTRYMPQSGGRNDIGVIPGWYVRYLYTMDPGMYALLIGMGEVSGHVPFHFRESAVGKLYDSSGTSATGHHLSINARPTVYTPNLFYSGQNASDMMNPIGPMSTNGWDTTWRTSGFAHPVPDHGRLVFPRRAVLGARDWRLESPHVQLPPPTGNWGYFNDQGIQTRGQAWGMRDIAEAGFAAPDGSPEKGYFTEKVNNNLAVIEGYQNTTTGNFYQACTTNPYNESSEGSKWCWGRKSAAWNMPNPLHFGAIGGSAPVLTQDPNEVPPSDPNAPSYGNQYWQTMYKLHVAGHVQELGYPAAGANAAQFNFLLHMLGDPAFNPYLCGTYMGGTVAKSTGVFYGDWTQLKSSFSTNFAGTGINLQTVNYWWDTTSDDKIPDGYPHLCQAAASYLPPYNDGVSGQAAWNWTVTNVSSAPFSISPQYAVVPR